MRRIALQLLVEIARVGQRRRPGIPARSGSATGDRADERRRRRRVSSVRQLWRPWVESSGPARAARRQVVTDCNARRRAATSGCKSVARRAERAPIMRSKSVRSRRIAVAPHSPKGHDMTFHRTFRTIAGVAAVAVATAFGAGVALAQPHGGPHGHHGGGARRDDRAPDRPRQGEAQPQHDAASRCSTRRSPTARRPANPGARCTTRSRPRCRRSSRSPSPTSPPSPPPPMPRRTRPARSATPIRAEWLALYATFTPEQKAVVQRHPAEADGAHGIVPREDARAHAREGSAPRSS